MKTYEELEDRISAAIAAADPELFDILALEVYEFQRAHNAPYDAYCRSLGPQAPSHWRDIPALQQSAFKIAPLRSYPASEDVATFRTSGTTGEGYGEHHFRSLRLYDEAILRGWDLLGLPVLPQVILIPSPADAPHSSLSHMMGTLKARGEQHWRTAITESDRPILLLGTALSFLHCFEAMPGNLRLPPGSLAFETGGYKGSRRTLAKPELYEMFRARLGLEPDQVINEYGMTELSSQFYARGIGKPHTAPPWMRAIAVDPLTGREVADGETGLLRIFDLANLGSVLAIQTRDLAICRGADFELIGRDPTALPRGCSRAADEMWGGA